MLRLRGLGCLGVPILLLAASVAQTQDAGPPADAPDPPELEAIYDRAIDALAAGDWATAAEGFEDVAARSTRAGRRSAAQDLAREARERASREPPQAYRADADAGAPTAPWAPPGAETPAAARTIPAPPPGPWAAPAAEPAPAERPAGRPNQEGRAFLLVGSTLYGLGVAGPLTPLALGLDDTKAFVGVYMLVAGGSFFFPFLVTRHAAVPWGGPVLGLSAGLRGVGHGALLAVAAADPRDEQALFASMLATSLVELGATYAWADLTDMDPGTAHAVYTGSDFGLGLAFALGAFAAGDDLDLEHQPAVPVGMLLGALAGGAAGRLVAGARTWTWGDVETLQTVGLLGVYSAALPMVLFEVERLRIVSAFLAAGGIAGLVAGDRLVAGRDLTTGQGVLTELGALAGGLVGAGLGYLVFSDSDGDLDDDGVKAMLSLSLVSAWGGMVGTFLLLDVDDEPAGRTGGGGGDGDGVHAQLAPWLDPRGARGVMLGGTF